MTQIFRILIITSLLIFLSSCKNSVDEYKESAIVRPLSIFKNNSPKQINNIEYIDCQKNNTREDKFLNNNEDKSLSMTHNTPANIDFQYETEYVPKTISPTLSFSSIASRTFLTELFTVDSKLRFRTLPFSFCFALLIADGWMAKIASPFLPLIPPSPFRGEGGMREFDFFNILG